MERDFFEELFKLKLDEVQKMQKDLWDKWTWDDSSPDVKSKIDQIDTYLEARKSMGLDAAS